MTQVAVAGYIQDNLLRLGKKSVLQNLATYCQMFLRGETHPGRQNKCSKMLTMNVLQMKGTILFFKLASRLKKKVLSVLGKNATYTTVHTM